MCARVVRQNTATKGGTGRGSSGAGGPRLSKVTIGPLSGLYSTSASTLRTLEKTTLVDFALIKGLLFFFLKQKTYTSGMGTEGS